MNKQKVSTFLFIYNKLVNESFLQFTKLNGDPIWDSGEDMYLNEVYYYEQLYVQWRYRFKIKYYSALILFLNSLSKDCEETMFKKRKELFGVNAKFVGLKAQVAGDNL